MIVTIDGPAGAGKSSIARQVAERLDYEFLDTGALYRAVTFGAMQAGIDMGDPDALVRFAESIRVEWRDNAVFVDGVDVSDQIRTPDVTAAIHFVADPPSIRRILSELQRQVSADRNIVTEGRDQGTEVFPNAERKIFLTASPEERARRRCDQLTNSGQLASYDEILLAQNKRDEEDQSRPVGALRAADDAVVIKTDGMTPEQVIASVLETVFAATS